MPHCGMCGCHEGRGGSRLGCRTAVDTGIVMGAEASRLGRLSAVDISNARARRAAGCGTHRVQRARLSRDAEVAGWDAARLLLVLRWARRVAGWDAAQLILVMLGRGGCRLRDEARLLLVMLGRGGQPAAGLTASSARVYQGTRR
jgi:hypothetical protein